VQDRDGDHHGLHADPDALAGELVPGFFDGFAQRCVAGHLFGGDPDLARGHVDTDLGDTGELVLAGVALPVVWHVPPDALGAMPLESNM